MNYRRKLSSWLLPHTCLLCRNLATHHYDLCQACLDDLPRLMHPCPRCAKPGTSSWLCGECLKDPPFFDCIHALFAYEAPITHLIMQLKFNDALLHARLFSDLLLEKIRTDWYRDKPLPTLLTAVPLHPKRIKERGFNQALEIARPLARQLNLKLITTHRIQNTAAQATLAAKDRIKNIKNAFECRMNLNNQHIAVIEDVITTGHTIQEFCKTLKKAGAKNIDVWSCARAISSPSSTCGGRG